MRRAIIFLAVFVTAACSGSATDPSTIGAGNDVSGSWTGTFASSNNQTANIALTVEQKGSSLTGPWASTAVSWTGQLTGTMSSTSFTGQLSFSGTTVDQVVCTGTAAVTGAASSTEFTLSSTTGVVGPACPAALPVGVQIALHR